jgi:tetratricopeptide (TPR) repeat protein
LARFQRIGNTWESGFPLHALGLAALFENDAEEARKRFTEALEARSPSEDKRGMADALTGLSLTELRLGERRAAKEPLARALKLRAEVGDRPGQIETLEAVSEWALAAGNAASAAKLVAATARFRAEQELLLCPLFAPARKRLESDLAQALDETMRAMPLEAATELDLDRAMDLGRALLGLTPQSTAH